MLSLRYIPSGKLKAEDLRVVRENMAMHDAGKKMAAGIRKPSASCCGQSLPEIILLMKALFSENLEKRGFFIKI